MRGLARIAVVGRTGAAVARAVAVTAQRDNNHQDDKDKARADRHEDQPLEVGSDEGDDPEQNGVDGSRAARDADHADGLSHDAGAEGGEERRPDHIKEECPVHDLLAASRKLGIQHQADGEEDRADQQEDAALEEGCEEGDDPAADAADIGQSRIGAGSEAELGDQTGAEGSHDRSPEHVEGQERYCDFLDGVHVNHPV